MISIHTSWGANFGCAMSRLLAAQKTTTADGRRRSREYAWLICYTVLTTLFSRDPKIKREATPTSALARVMTFRESSELI